MTDHLHPTLKGQMMLGKLFFEKMEQSNYLPDTERANLSDNTQDSITLANFNFTVLDSTLGDFRIKILKNDWPFVDKKEKLPTSKLLHLKNRADSLAAEYLDNNITWEKAHRELAVYFLAQNNLNAFLEEMDAVISQYPVVVEYYDYVANVLIQLKEYGKAFKYLKAGYDIKPNAFKTKWLGTITLYNNELESAEKYLNESLKYDANDAQVWYNLAGVYVKRNDYKKALELVNKAVSLKSNYPEAVSLQRRLSGAVKKTN
jgi:tetratricopeptide (TPR) repeat protein